MSVYGSEARPWGVERIRAYCLWDNNNDTTVDEGANAGNGAVIAVIDSGIYYDWWSYPRVFHPDLQDNVYPYGPVPYGTCFYCSGGQVTQISDYWDYQNHGTPVSGIIAAVDNDIGVIGTAPKAYIYAVRYYAWDEPDQATAIAAAINWSVNYGIYIISISVGFNVDYSVLRAACESAYARGRLIIAAAGNTNGAILYPANYSSVVAVGAVDPSLQRWGGSCFGDQLELVAPGFNTTSTANPERYLFQYYMGENGTSAACPHVAGAAALIWRSKPDPDYTGGVNNPWNNTSVRAKLRDWALDLGDPGWDMYYGYGFINCWAPNQRPLGDINIDYKVDLTDVLIVANAFGSYPGHPKWDARADINIDNKVDLTDYLIVVINYGQEDP
jgi:subtilisin